MKKTGLYLLLVSFVGVFVVLYHDLIFGQKTFIHDSIVFYGIFQYYCDSLSTGNFPYWDPYMTAGTYFYPNIPVQGLLDPLVLMAFCLVKVFSISTLTGYMILMLLRLAVTVGGAFLLFRHISKSTVSALISSGVLLLALPHSYFPQFGVVAHLFYTPLVLYLLIRFLEDPLGPKRMPIFAGFLLVFGIALNIYIPVHFVFNVLAVTLLLLLFRVSRMDALIASLRTPGTLARYGLLTILFVMMLAVPLLVYFFDASSRGELFPMQRIVQKNNRVFKKIMASDTNSSNLSSKFTHERAVFNSTGNLAGLLYPDSPRNFKYWTDNDLSSEIHQYIGIIPFVLALIGIIYSRSRYRPVILGALLLTFLCGFSLSGAHDQPYNLIQRALNFLFPPLAMLQGRQNFGYFTILYLCAFTSMGLALILEEGGEIYKKRQRIAAIAAVVVAVKITITGYYSDRQLVISMLDAFILLQILLFSLLIYLKSSGRISSRILTWAIAILLLMDLGSYNALYRDEILQDSRSFREGLSSLHNSSVESRDFQYFRSPLVFMPFSHPIAFEESIARSKGALSYGFNHSFFVTKRYYDFLTHIPLRNQYVLDGVVYPVLQFFPADRAVPIANRRELIDFFAKAEPSEFVGKIYIEEPPRVPGPQEEMMEFSRYEDLPFLQAGPEMAAYEEFIRTNGPYMQSVRSNLQQMLHNGQASIEVLDFSVNSLKLRVSNTTEGYLYYNDGWSKYWEAFDNGLKIPVKIANYNFKAVYLSAGEHQLRFVFNPVHYKIGVWAYYLGLLISCSLISFILIKNRRQSSEDRRTTLPPVS